MDGASELPEDIFKNRWLKKWISKFVFCLFSFCIGRDKIPIPITRKTRLVGQQEFHWQNNRRRMAGLFSSSATDNERIMPNGHTIAASQTV